MIRYNENRNISHLLRALAESFWDLGHCGRRAWFGFVLVFFHFVQGLGVTGSKY